LTSLSKVLDNIEDRQRLADIGLVDMKILPTEQEVKDCLAELQEAMQEDSSLGANAQVEDEGSTTVGSTTLSLNETKYICRQCGTCFIHDPNYGWNTRDEPFCSEVCADKTRFATPAPVIDDEEGEIQMVALGGTVTIPVATTCTPPSSDVGGGDDVADLSTLAPEDSASQVVAVRPVNTPSQLRAEGVQIVVDIIDNVAQVRELEREAFIAGRSDVVAGCEEVLALRRRQLDESVLYAAVVADELEDSRSEVSVSDLGSDFDRTMLDFSYDVDDEDCEECRDFNSVCEECQSVLDQMESIINGSV